jgi:hypothetical protein
MELWNEMACEDFPNVHIASLDFQELHLQEVEPTSLSPNERHQLDEVIINYAQFFEATGPPTPIVEHHIHTGTSSPVSSPLYRITPGRQKILEQEVHLLETGVIEECESAWSSPVVLVPKPDGSTRLCVDYRKLNEIAIPDTYPLPRLEHLLHSTGQSNFISTMDLRSGYHQVQVHEPYRDKIAFITSFGTYRFLRLPFGLRNAPATFQRLMDKFKAGLKDVRILVYLDDIIVLSAD